MQAFKRYKWEFFAAFSLVFLYITTRLLHILTLPIFTDEAIYIRWAQIAKDDASWRFISLTDGKQPLFIWFVMLSLRFFHDPLLAGRMVSVLGGLLGAIGVGMVAHKVFKNVTIGIIASFLYVILPFSLVYDKLALYEAWTGALTMWALYFQLFLIHLPRLDLAYTTGFVMGAAMLNKSSGFFTAYLLPFYLLLFDWNKRNRISRLIKWITMAVVSVVVSYSMYSVLRLSPWFNMIDEKNLTFIFSFNEWLMHPFRFFLGNLRGEWDWFHSYITWFFVFFTAVGFLIYPKTYLKEKLILLVWFLVPFLILALFGKVLYPRYLHFMVLPLLPVAAYGLYSLKSFFKSNIVFISTILLLFIQPLYFDWQIVGDIKNAPLPLADRGQLLDDWPAGYGVKEVIAYITEQSKNGPVFLGTEGTFGLFPAAFEIYLVKNKKIELKGFWPIHDDTLQILLEKARKEPTFFVLKESEKPKDGWPLTEIFSIQRGNGNSYLRFYRVNPIFPSNYSGKPSWK